MDERMKAPVVDVEKENSMGTMDRYAAYMNGMRKLAEEVKTARESREKAERMGGKA